MEEIKFVLYFGNRGFFPEFLISEARKEMKEVLTKLGYQFLIMDENLTKYGAVETVEEGEKFATFLNQHKGEYDGVIVSLPNFGDENGIIAALANCGVPILIQAYPDEIGKMDFQQRRDAFCGKISIMNAFYQNNIPFTVFKPHTVHPKTQDFEIQLKWFSAICRIVKKMKRFSIGAIGARTTAFKSVRFDELTLQKYGITTETIDLSELLLRVKDIKTGTEKFVQKINRLKNYTNWNSVPEEKLSALARLSLGIDDIINEYKLDCIALRCWIEIEKILGVSPCVLLSELNDRGIVSVCETDICNAIVMYALSLASQMPSACLDWNNNYGDDEDKCILFHCGSTAQSMMREKGQIIEHPMFAKSFGKGCGWGCNVGRIKESPMTFASSKTENGKLAFYIGEGKFTNDIIEEDFFGCAGVAEINGLQDKLISIGSHGFHHHVAVTFGHNKIPVKEALTKYLGYDFFEI